MAERPILFSAPMVRAILAGTKTQTRRLVKPQPEPRGHNGGAFMDIVPSVLPNRGGLFDVRYALDNPRAIRCPYGEPGDQLWVRENGWERPERTPKMMREGADTWAPYYYDADGINALEASDLKAWGFKRRPSIHMPRWACRVELEITGVRVERLQEISEADAVAEGCPGGHGSIPGYHYSATPCEQFRRLWQTINGPASWDANPFVWVVEFKRAAPKEGA